MNFGKSSNFLAVFAILVALAAQARAAIIVTNNFDSDPLWTGVNNTSGGANYGFSPGTSNAGGSAGEVGGLFTRQAAENYYAHVFMSGVGTDVLNYDSEIEGSGRFIVSSLSAFDNNVLIGHRSSSLSDFSFLGLFIAESTPSLVRTYAGIVADDGTLFLGGPMFASVGTAYDFGYDYDPQGGVNSLGRLTLTVTGLGTVFTDVSASQRSADPIFLNAFGIGTPSVSSVPSNQANVFFDNAIYTIPEPTSVVLLCLAGLALARRRR